jgi:hypothetical protein
MTLGIRKLIVLGLVVGIFLLGNVWLVVNWLQEHGLIDWARYLRTEYLTGTAITIILVLLVLLARPSGERSRWLRRCSVCDHVMVTHGRYCTDCLPF